ncbi:hypothetical protein KGP36_02940 [Patescibacteria group bacterium]|nr:hypothetical protein [Patescibacteria group bacterium]
MSDDCDSYCQSCQQRDQFTDHASRIAVLESTLQRVLEHNKKVEDKMDQLLAIKYKGAGVFWLFSIISGGGLLATLGYAIEWLKGVH